MNDDERVVRAAWESVSTWWDREYDEEWITARFGPRYGDHVKLFKGHATQAEAWHAARLFTETRQKEVRLLDRDIHIIDMESRIREGSAGAQELEICLQRLRDIRAGLVRGMKEETK